MPHQLSSFIIHVFGLQARPSYPSSITQSALADEQELFQSDLIGISTSCSRFSNNAEFHIRVVINHFTHQIILYCCMDMNQWTMVLVFFHSFITGIHIAPLQGGGYSEV